ncbi:uncharacterized protein LOC107459752 isoform X2 [Arachis duranensis]|uniref:Uncharacterized protein LOC107459752 isoform X2 n=1 Tax=Arachis duranensis TaxID=130453 RepID=A0A6P4BYH4_ARADU|nr:uncharacterized protein LOC107459752 isoform X2 [Arachis duranensis]XP_029152608.1 uncharacterized protein LOC114926231 isoform X2 [Arachis hypogaea]
MPVQMSACWHNSGSNALSVSRFRYRFEPLIHSHHHCLSTQSQLQSHSIFLFRRLTFATCSPARAQTPLQEMSFIQSKSEQEGEEDDAAAAAASVSPTYSDNTATHADEQDLEEEVGISKIQVPRQKHIPISKSQLLDAILSVLFNQDQDDLDDAHHFRLLTSCLDSILHAEHKNILEEMRFDYYLTSVQTEDAVVQNPADSQTPVVPNGKESNLVSNDILGIENREVYQDVPVDEQEKPIPSNYGLDLRRLLPALDKKSKKDHGRGSRVTVATRFQHAFMQLLSDAQFEELSARDLMLTSALNTDYLLTLPIYVDWKRAYESNAIIFRRGYATEKQKGLLLVEKLDYLQSMLLRRIFYIISKPLGKLGTWISETYENASRDHRLQSWAERLRLWIKELSLFKKSLLYDEHASDEQMGPNNAPNGELPIWLVAQRAVARYEGILSPIGPRERLLRRLLSWIGLIPPTPEAPFEVDNDSNTSEPYLRPTFLSRISLSDIWRPATRKYCRNDPWKMLKTSISILLSQSVLQEPAFEELILLYTKEVDETNSRDEAEVPSLQLKIYERIPFPDLPVIFPHKKLSFRIIDTVRLDIATILGLLAYFINYKFENVLSSPSAILLDVVAVSALIIYGSRVVLGYKQTRDRYQLLVNKTLYEKTLASGFGSVHFLLDASEQQQYKEAILAYAVLLKAEKGQVTSRQSVREICERFMYEMFKVEMPVDKALSTLLRLNLATETCIDGRLGLLAIPCPKAYQNLKERWNGLLS